MKLNFYDNIYNILRRNPEQVYIVWPHVASPSGMEASGKKGRKETEQAGRTTLTANLAPNLAAKRYTGRDILNTVSAYRSLLQKRRIIAGQEVLLALPLSFELICALLATMAHGAIPVLPAAGAGSADLFRLLRKRPVKGVVTAGKLPFFLSLLLAGLHIKQISTQFKQDTNQLKQGSRQQFNTQKRSTETEEALASATRITASWEPAAKVEQEQPALISHSSGSTGKAKAIFRSHRILLAQHRALTTAFPPFPEQHDFPLFPNILLHNLSLGIRSILPALPAFDLLQTEPARLLDQIKEEHIHTLTGNVFYFQKILAGLQQQTVVFQELKALGIGGSPVPEPLLLGLKNYFPQATLYVIYGSTEAEPMAIRKLKGASPPATAGYPVGKFIPSLHWRLRPLGKIILKDREHEVGEIEVKGPHVVSPDKEGCLQTGDFGYLDEQGNLFLTGRKGNERIHGGIQHYQLEHFLLHIPGVERAAAISGLKDFDVYLQGAGIELDKVLSRLKEAFPEQVIGKLYLRENIPVDARHHSKILYAKVS